MLFLRLHVRYLQAGFATYFILSFYRSTSTIFPNQHLVLKKSALLSLKWSPCFSVLWWLSSSLRIAHNGVSRRRKTTIITCETQLRNNRKNN